ncbi:MAG: PVC-type heme-binding CxxCH protein [Planctomyces sp.]
MRIPHSPTCAQHNDSQPAPPKPTRNLKQRKPNRERTTDLPIGKIRLLVDDNDDGTFDRSTIFARDLSWPTGIVVWKDGIFVAATPDLWWLQDADHDGIAEIRQPILTGFRKLNVQAVANNLLWTLDHHICGAGGTNGGLLSGTALDPHTPTPLTMSRHDFRFSPLGPPHHFQLLSGGARFGNTADDWGNRFICNIRNPVQHVLLPLEHLSRNPHFNPGSPLHDVAASGDQLPVFRTSPPEAWRIINAARLTGQGDPRMPRSEKNAAGYLTSACGVTVYRGDAWPPEFRSQVFLSDVAANLVHRQQLTPAGPTFSSRRIDQNCEFLTSTDNWFRPVNFIHAPDGTLYLLDMYRETIEHPWSMPDDLKGMLDLERGRDRGRIYRITPPNFNRRPTPRLSQSPTTELVKLLEHPNAWHRDSAARLLFQQQDPDTPAPQHSAPHKITNASSSSPPSGSPASAQTPNTSLSCCCSPVSWAIATSPPNCALSPRNSTACRNRTAPHNTSQNCSPQSIRDSAAVAAVSPSHGRISPMHWPSSNTSLKTPATQLWITHSPRNSAPPPSDCWHLAHSRTFC